MLTFGTLSLKKNTSVLKWWKLRFFHKSNKICSKLRRGANFAAANLPLRPQKTTMTALPIRCSILPFSCSYHHNPGLSEVRGLAFSWIHRLMWPRHSGRECWSTTLTVCGLLFPNSGRPTRFYRPATRTGFISIYTDFLPLEFGKIPIFFFKIWQNIDCSGMREVFSCSHTDFPQKILIFLVIYTDFVLYQSGRSAFIEIDRKQ